MTGQIDLTAPLFMIPVLTGSVFFLAGLVMHLFPPKKINMLYGYRTKNSMKDQKRWDFAQDYSAKKMMLYGGVFALSGIIGLVIKTDEMTGMYIGLGFMFLVVVLLLYSTETAINKKFGKDQKV